MEIVLKILVILGGIYLLSKLIMLIRFKKAYTLTLHEKRIRLLCLLQEFDKLPRVSRFLCLIYATQYETPLKYDIPELYSKRDSWLFEEWFINDNNRRKAIVTTINELTIKILKKC